MLQNDFFASALIKLAWFYFWTGNINCELDRDPREDEAQFSWSCVALTVTVQY